MKKQLNTTTIYVLSIISFLCCCFAGLGTFLALPAFIMANNKVKDATLNPDDYEGDFNAMNTAKIVALVALIINGLYLLYNIYFFATTDWDAFMEKFNEAMQQQQ